MHRRLSILGLAVAALAASDRGSTARAAEMTATVYIGRHFEVRDHDQPVKYAFNGETRVARITGSLSPNQRLQRIRLRAGWNLVSLGVTAQDLIGQCQRFTVGDEMAPLLRGVYRWRASTADYAAVESGEVALAGTVLWLLARTNFVIALQGEYVPPVAPIIPAGGGYAPGPGWESWPLLLPLGVTVWKYAAAAGVWQTGFAGDLAPLSNLPSELAPGDVVYVQTAESIELAVPDPALRLAYYHPDHLGSASVMTDGVGALAEETAYHPFGAARHRHRPREPHTFYGFTQKEQDRESALNYFEARYLASRLARFLSCDPLLLRLETLEAEELRNVLTQPAKLNPFVYALNNPVRYIDPDGRDVRPRPSETIPKPPAPELTIRLGPPSKRPGEISALAFSVDVQAPQPNPAAGGSRARHQSVDLQITRHTDRASTELQQKSLNSQPIKSLTIIVPGKDGNEVHIQMTDVVIGSVRVTDDPWQGKLVETLTLNPGTIKFVDPKSESTPAREEVDWSRRDFRIDR